MTPTGDLGMLRPFERRFRPDSSVFGRIVADQRANDPYPGAEIPTQLRETAVRVQDLGSRGRMSLRAPTLDSFRPTPNPVGRPASERMTSATSGSHVSVSSGTVPAPGRDPIVLHRGGYADGS
jgi:hypothetical protein